MNIPKTEYTEIEAVLFDLDGTLVQHTHVLLPEKLSAWGHPRTEEEIDDAFHMQIEWFYSYAQSLSAAGRNDPDIWTRFYRRVIAHLAINDTEVALQIQRFLFEEPTPPLFPDVLPTVRKLADSSKHMGVITQRGRNGATRFLADHGILGQFDVVVAGDDDRGRKPSAEPFLFALSRMDIKPEQAVYVGDRIDDDCAGANEAGLTPFLIDRRGIHKPPPDGAFTLLRSLDELLGYL